MNRTRSEPVGCISTAPDGQPEPEHDATATTAGEQPAGPLVPAGDPVAGRRSDARVAANGEPEDIQSGGARAPARLANVPLDASLKRASPCSLKKRREFS